MRDLLRGQEGEVPEADRHYASEDFSVLIHEKTVNIEKELAPFSIDIDELEKILKNLLKELFYNEEDSSV